MGVRSFVLDGDNVRHGLNASPGRLKERHGEEFAKRFGLGFSAQDREENIRRIGAVAELSAPPASWCNRVHQSLSASDRDAVRARLKPAISSRCASIRQLKSAKNAIPKACTKKLGQAS